MHRLRRIICSLLIFALVAFDLHPVAAFVIGTTGSSVGDTAQVLDGTGKMGLDTVFVFAVFASFFSAL